MTEYETGRKARREGQSLQANPYWGWFLQLAWERGWVDEDATLQLAQESRRPARRQYAAVAARA
jgi:hypothetical protein